MTTQLKALGAFSGPDGDRQADELFTVEDDRVEFLVSNELAIVVEADHKPAIAKTA